LTGPAHTTSLAPWLQVQDLGHAWVQSPRWASGWSTQIHAGLTVITGGDGAGKTTCLRLLAGECPPSRGTLHLHTPAGLTLAAWPQAHAPTQLPNQTASHSPSPSVPHSYQANVFWCNPASDTLDRLSAEAYLAHHQAVHPGWNPAVVADLLQALDLEGHLHKPLWGLSMGMRRKLRLAAALGSGALLTLLDDPLAALDHGSCQLVAELMQDGSQATHRLVVATAFDLETAHHWGASQVWAL